MRVRLPLRIPRPLSSTVEQVTHNRLVVGSNPTGATNLCSISSIGQSNCLLSNWLQVRVLYAAPLWVVSSVGSSSGLLSHRSWVRVPHNPLRRTQKVTHYEDACHDQRCCHYDCRCSVAYGVCCHRSGNVVNHFLIPDVSL